MEKWRRRKALQAMSLVGLSVAATAVGLNACGGESVENVNAKFKENLERKIGLGTFFTRDDIARLQINHAYDLWNRDTYLGEFYAGGKKRVGIRTAPIGELVWNTEFKKVYLYPGYTQVEAFEGRDILKEGKIVVRAYGTKDFLDKFCEKEEEKEILRIFMRDYSSSTRGDYFVLHLNAVPRANPLKKINFKSVGVSDMGDVPQLSQAANRTVFKQNHKDVERTDIILNLENIHNDTPNLGLSLKERLTMSLVNEAVNFNGDNVSPVDINMGHSPTERNEAPSALVGLDSLFNPRVVEVMLGQNSGVFCGLLEGYMNRLVGGEFGRNITTHGRLVYKYEERHPDSLQIHPAGTFQQFPLAA